MAVLRLRKRGTPRLLQRLDVSQEGHQLVLAIQLRPGVRVHGLWAYHADADSWWALPAPSKGPTGHRTVIDLVETAARLPALETAIELFLDVEHELTAGSGEANRVALAPLAVLNDLPAEATHARYRMRLGRSVDTRIGRLQAVKTDDRQIVAYPTRGGYLALALNRNLAPFADVHVRAISVRGGVLRLRGRLLTRHGDVQRVELLLKGRN